MESQDPRKDVLAGTVTVRAAAARDLARIGTWEDLPTLVQLGWNDKSTSVRLYTAAAAADLVGRRRGAFGQDTLSKEERDLVFGWAFGGDPGRNPSMLMLAAAVDEPRTLVRLARILRDPRSDVRFGAVTALRRLVLSSAAQRPAISAAIAEWLADGRTPTDTRAELIKVIGEAGLGSLKGVVVASTSINDGFAEVRALALERLTALERPESYRGLWRSDGRDVFENVEARRDELAVCGEAGWFSAAGAGAFRVERGQAFVHDKPLHLVWAHPLGAVEAERALQLDGSTWWGVKDKEVAELLADETQRFLTLPKEAMGTVRGLIEGVEGASAERALPIARWFTGDHAGALTELDALMARKKPRADQHWWRARILIDLGRGEEAKADLREFIERSKAKAPWVADATRLLAELGG
jgi:hypothetical protein